MGGLKEIRRRITSINNTKQITRAMKLVSAAKLRRAQDSCLNGRYFTERLNRSLRQAILDAGGGFEHELLKEREETKKRRIVFIAGERGLCGGYNNNLLKAVQTEVAGTSIESDFVPIGRRSVSAAQRNAWKVEANYEGLSEDASLWPVDEIIASARRDFVKGDCDEVVLYYTFFASAMTQEVRRVQLLPLSVSSLGGNDASDVSAGVYEYGPNAGFVLQETIPLVIRQRLLQAGLESKASEHAARMTAMDSATSNASDLIDKLKLHYNRARQSAITTELIDIIGGAEALK